MPFFVYIIQSKKDNYYYIGSTHDLVSKLERHNQGRSKYTKAKRPWDLIYFEKYPDRPAASKRENQIKKRKSKTFIETLVRTSR
jgi:putative endonuclease